MLYYGDELDMPQAVIPPELERDIAGRDGARTPLPWNSGWKNPWLPLAAGVASVARQRDDPNSFLNFCRQLLARRRSSQDLLGGSYETLPSPTGVWMFRRGAGTLVALNLSDEPAEVEGLGGRTLAPWECVIVDA